VQAIEHSSAGGERVPRSARAALSSWDARLCRDRLGTRVAILTGAVFIPAGLVKFAFHAWELRAFHAFGLPCAAALVILAGVLEIAGGVLLVLRRLVVPVALLLSVTMLVAIGASGIGHGDVIPSLTLAPALLAGLLFVLVRTLRRPARAPSTAMRGAR
jgi:uncharacterized membrane protein YphA (DoxX/SURF4 family)